MEETFDPDLEYCNGFNQGYLLAQFMPELSNQLQGKDLDSERSRGFFDGQKQYMYESKENRMPLWLKANSHIRKSKTPENIKGKDSFDRT